jgi:hypothetical protein
MPEAVVRDRDGYSKVLYDKLGLKFQTYHHWIASGGRISVTARSSAPMIREERRNAHNLPWTKYPGKL